MTTRATSVPPWGISELAWELTPALDVATRFVADGSLPCIVFGVIDAGGRSEVFALSGPRYDVTDDSVFFIASVTKAIMATAVMRYVEEGRLDLHAPLARYVPAFSGDGRELVSAWHVLTHTSGLPDIPPEQLRDERPAYARLLRDTLASVPRWTPGTRYEYCTAAWMLLSELIARLSNLPFPAVLEQRLLEPLAMHDTTFDARRLRRRLLPVDGASADNRLVGELLLWFLARATIPGGGLFSSVPDLLRLGWALLPPAPEDPAAPRILSRATVARMAEPQIEGVPHIDEDGHVSYVRQGIGWRKSEAGWPAGDAVLTHGGHSGARLWVDPQRGFAYAFLTNVWSAPPAAAVAVLEEVYRAQEAGGAAG